MYMGFFRILLADAAPGSPAPTGMFGGPLPLLVIMAVMMYFLLIRPQQLRAKQQRKMQDALKPGDEILTTSGLIGTVITIKERRITVRSGDAKLEFTRDAISAVLNPDNAPASPTAKS